MSKWYKDRDFPEVKASNADVIAHIPNPKQLQRVIDEQNKLLDKLEIAFIALKQIESERDVVTSNSTGMKQYFKTLGAQISEKALEEIEKLDDT